MGVGLAGGEALGDGSLDVVGGLHSVAEMRRGLGGDGGYSPSPRSHAPSGSSWCIGTLLGWVVGGCDRRGGRARRHALPGQYDRAVACPAGAESGNVGGQHVGGVGAEQPAGRVAKALARKQALAGRGGGWFGETRCGMFDVARLRATTTTTRIFRSLIRSLSTIASGIGVR